MDSRADTDLYRKNFEAICRAIAESISGVKIPGEPSPIEPPAPPPTEPELPSGNNVVDIMIKGKGNAAVSINGDPINIIKEDRAALPKVELMLAFEGDVIVTVNGEDFQITPDTLPPSR